MVFQLLFSIPCKIEVIILLKSERAAMRVMEGITGHLENNLNLPVNKEKSQVALVKDIAFKKK